jgi:MFS family permease
MYDRASDSQHSVVLPCGIRCRMWTFVRGPSSSQYCDATSGAPRTIHGLKDALAPLRLPGFGRLAGAYTVNELGNWVGEIALAVLVFDETGSPLATAGLFIGMHFLPAFLSQAVVARTEPIGTKAVLPALYLGEAVTFTALALTAGSFSLPLVIGLAIVDGTLAIAARAFTRASAAAVLTPADQLRQGNAVINVGFTGAGALGPAIGGLVVAGLGVKTALFCDAASFVVVAAMLALARALPQVKARPETARRRLAAGLGYVRRNRPLAALLAAQGVAFIFFTAVIPIEIVYAKDTLGAGDSGYGALLSAWGVGMVAGSLIFTAVGRGASLKTLLFFSTLAIGISYLGLAAAGTLLLACVAGAVGGIGNGVQWVSVMSAVQELTASQFQARVVGLLEAVGKAMPGVGFLLGGAIAAIFSPRASFLTAGLGVIAVLSVVTPVLSRARWVERTPTPLEDAPQAAGAGPGP